MAGLYNSPLDPENNRLMSFEGSPLLTQGRLDPITSIFMSHVILILCRASELKEEDKACEIISKWTISRSCGKDLCTFLDKTKIAKVRVLKLLKIDMAWVGLLNGLHGSSVGRVVEVQRLWVRHNFLTDKAFWATLQVSNYKV